MLKSTKVVSESGRQFIEVAAEKCDKAFSLEGTPLKPCSTAVGDIIYRANGLIIKSACRENGREEVIELRIGENGRIEKRRPSSDRLGRRNVRLSRFIGCVNVIF